MANPLDLLALSRRAWDMQHLDPVAGSDNPLLTERFVSAVRDGEVRDDSAGPYGVLDSAHLSWPDYLRALGSDVGSGATNLATGLVRSLSPFGTSEQGNVALQMPPFIQEPINAFGRLTNTPLGTIADPQDAQNQQDALVGLLSLYGGNALNPANFGTKVFKNASKNASMYDPPAMPLRPFEADYSTGAKASAEGRLTHDIEGRPLTAKYIVGRRTVGGADEAITPAEIDAITETITGNRPQGVTTSSLGGDAGAFSVDYGTGQPVYNSYFDKALKPHVADRVRAHELAHGIDYFAGGKAGIPTSELFSKTPGQGIGQVYHDLNDSSTRAGKPTPQRYQTRPKDRKYKGDDIRAENMAEAIRAYMADPNYVKTVAPNTAKRIREYVNDNPRLNGTIQFNSDTGRPSLMGSAVASAEPDQRQQASLMDLLRQYGLLGADTGWNLGSHEQPAWLK